MISTGQKIIIIIKNVYICKKKGKKIYIYILGSLDSTQKNSKKCLSQFILHTFLSGKPDMLRGL